jgi:hypothetical protein
MTTTEIPRNEWVNFFYGFNQRHKGWLVNTEIVGDEDHGHIQARQLPFEGITPELGAGADEIEVVVGERPDRHLSHTVKSPTHIYLHQTPEGADESLEIQSTSATVVLRFRSAILPEMVDGL